MSRSSILVVGIAAVLMVCALGGAIAVMNSDTDDSQRINTRSTSGSYSSDRNTNSTDDSILLPFTTEGLREMLGDEDYGFDEEDNLFDALRGERFALGNDIITINTIEDLTEYLCSTGYIFIGNSLTDSSIIRSESVVKINAAPAALQVSVPKEVDILEESAKYANTIDKQQVLCVAGAAPAVSEYSEKTATGPFYDVNDLLVGDMVDIKFVADSFMSVNALYEYAYDNCGPEDTLLEMMYGTPFMDGMSDEVRYIEDANDLSAYMFSIGYTVIGNSLINCIDGGFMIYHIEKYLSTQKELVTSEKPQLDEDGELVRASSFREEAMLPYFDIQTMYQKSGLNFVNLGDVCLGDFVERQFIDNRIASVIDDHVFGQIIGAYIYDIDHKKVKLTEEYFLGAENVNDFADKRGVVKALTVSDMSPLVQSFCGTVFINADGEVECITDSDTMSDYLSSVGLTSYDGDIYYFYYCDYDSGELICADLGELSFYELYCIVTEYYDEYISYSIDMDNLENVDKAEGKPTEAAA